MIYRLEMLLKSSNRLVVVDATIDSCAIGKSRYFSVHHDYCRCVLVISEAKVDSFLKGTLVWGTYFPPKDEGKRTIVYLARVV